MQRYKYYVQRGYIPVHSLSAWCDDAEFQLGEGNSPTIEISACCSISGNPELFTVSDKGVTNMHNFPENIQAAINAIWQWVQLGCPEHDTFNISYGLCSNIHRFTHWEYTYKEIKDICFNGKKYLFNRDNLEYSKDADNGLHYRNPKRLEWLKNHATN